MKLVIAEKPSVAADIARVLGAKQRKEDHYLGAGYAVTWARGHLLEIAPPQALNAAWEKWDESTLPMLPGFWLYAPRSGATKQLRAVSKLLREAELVIAATDAGREGEHIFRLIYEHSRSKAPVRRLWISSLTDEAIRAGFAALHAGSDFDCLAAAAAARAHADWLVGMNATRAYTLRNGDKCTIGRVQTPTLALLVKRQQEIEAFRPVPYAEIRVSLDPGFRARLLLDGKPRIDDLARARAILQEITPLPSATVRSVETKEVRTPPPPLFNLLGLQKEANKRFGLTAARVLELAQDLYERKHLTYPRTESRHLSTDMVKDLPRHVTALERLYPAAAELARDALSSGAELGKAYVDDTKLTDHHAIIPTTVAPGPDLAGEVRKLYDLVARRFLGVFLPPKKSAETVAVLDLGVHTLRAQGTVLEDPGWTVVEEASPRSEEPEDEEAERPQALPLLAAGQVVKKQGQELVEKKTKPPKPYTDASLLDAMKLAGRLVEDAQLAEYMKENGLGTPATRAAIIEKLLDVGYAERRKKALLPTAKGIALIRQVHPSLSDPLLTAQWERHLADIEAGEARASDFETLVSSFVATLIPEVLAMPPIEKPEPPSLGTCPVCKEGQVRAVPQGKGWGCSRHKEADCPFVIWSEIAGRKITEAVARELVTTGLTAKPVDGFTSKSNTKFSARLKLDENARVVFVFEERAPAKELGPCPACKEGTVRATPKGWGCSRYREGCSLTIWHEYHGKTIGEDVARELLEKGATASALEGFTSRDGQKRFTARLRFDERWRVVLDFDDKPAETTPPAA
jgi:DNA topoisomerase-3